MRPRPLVDDRVAADVGQGGQPDRPLEDVEDDVAEPPDGGVPPAPFAGARRRTPMSGSARRDEGQVVPVVARSRSSADTSRRLQAAARRREQQPRHRLGGVGPAHLQVTGVGRPHEVDPAGARCGRRRPASGRAGRGPGAAARSPGSGGRSRPVRRPRSRWTAAGSSPRAGRRPPPEPPSPSGARAGRGLAGIGDDVGEDPPHLLVGRLPVDRVDRRPDRLVAQDAAVDEELRAAGSWPGRRSTPIGRRAAGSRRRPAPGRARRLPGTTRCSGRPRPAGPSRCGCAGCRGRCWPGRARRSRGPT